MHASNLRKKAENISRIETSQNVEYYGIRVWGKIALCRGRIMASEEKIKEAMDWYDKNAPSYKKCRFLSLKEDSRFHGYGLMSVRRTVEKYDGTIDLYFDEERFEACVTIYDGVEE